MSADRVPTIDEHVAQLVATFPPLSDNQKDAIRTLFAPPSAVRTRRWRTPQSGEAS